MSEASIHGAQSTRRLKVDGLPMRCLRALAASPVAMHEEQVFQATRRGVQDVSMRHSALSTLVALGLAERGGVRGGYRWSITAAGREVVEGGPSGG